MSKLCIRVSIENDRELYRSAIDLDLLSHQAEAFAPFDLCDASVAVFTRTPGKSHADVVKLRVDVASELAVTLAAHLVQAMESRDMRNGYEVRA
jgi:hypothetical protein